MHLRILFFSTLLASCEQPTNETEVCYICSDRPPYAVLCENQIGQVNLESDRYYCNLYFGESQLCQTQVTCCEAMGGVVDDLGASLREESEVDAERL